MNTGFAKFDLRGKTALVTGAAGLLGTEHALALLSSGAQVVLTDIREQAFEKVVDAASTFGAADRVHACVLDVTRKESVLSAAEFVAKNGLRIDILVNNAAIDPKVSDKGALLEASRLEHFELEQWDRQISVGLTGAFLCSQTFGSAMAADGRGGVILNIASDLSVFSPDQRIYRNEGLPADQQPVKPVTYSVIKTALIGLTRYLATYWAHQGVRCNALSPGGVYNGQQDDFVQRLSSLIPLGRMAHFDEYRSAIQFLCSDASSYMNGQNVVIDGGRSVW